MVTGNQISVVHFFRILLIKSFRSITFVSLESDIRIIHLHLIFYIKLLFHVGVKSIYLLNRARSETTDGYAASETASLLFSDTSTRESSPHKPIHMEMNGFKTSTPKANTIASMTGLRYNFTKMSIITILGHKYFEQKLITKFDIFHEKISFSFDIGLYSESNCKILNHITCVCTSKMIDKFCTKWQLY